MYIVRIERRIERILTRPCAARSTLVYLERGGVPRCTKSVESVNQASWRGKWSPGEVLDPSHKQRCIIWNAWCEILHILRQLNAEPCPAWTTERGKLKRGWSPGDSLNLVRVLSVRVNYSQQCRNDINGRWEYSKSIIINIKKRFTLIRHSVALSQVCLNVVRYQHTCCNTATCTYCVYSLACDLWSCCAQRLWVWRGHDFPVLLTNYPLRSYWVPAAVIDSVAPRPDNIESDID